MPRRGLSSHVQEPERRRIVREHPTSVAVALRAAAAWRGAVSWEDWAPAAGPTACAAVEHPGRTPHAAISVVELLANQFRDHWFVVARSSEVNGSAPLSVTGFGKPFALVRDPRSGVIAFEDRCPHRGVPLSLGKLGSEGLVCGYHT
jgi:hypothetical protein